MDPLGIWDKITGPGGLLFTLAFIIYTNFVGIWEWGRIVRASERRHVEEIAELKGRLDLWQSVAFRNEASATTALELAKARGTTL